METLMDVTDLAAMLKRPDSWVYDNYRKLGIPFVRVGRGLRFKPSEIERWLDEHSGEGR
jgi:excisionase family DNA binding protein